MREAGCGKREAVNYLVEYSLDRGYGFRFALESKPNEPRGDIYMATTGAYLGFISTLDHPELVGVNPEVAHQTMAGLNFLHAVAQAWEAGKLFHIDLNDQAPGRYDQDFRFGAANPKSAFFLVKFLEDVGYAGPRHFDAQWLATRPRIVTRCSLRPLIGPPSPPRDSATSGSISSPWTCSWEPGEG